MYEQLVLDFIRILSIWGVMSVVGEFRELCPFEIVPREGRRYAHNCWDVEYPSPFFPAGGKPPETKSDFREFQADEVVFKPNQSDRFIAEYLLGRIYVRVLELAEKMCDPNKLPEKADSDIILSLFDNLPSESFRGSAVLADSKTFSEFLKGADLPLHFFGAADSNKFFSKTAFPYGARLINPPVRKSLILFYAVENIIVAEPEINGDKSKATFFYDLISPSLCNLYSP